MRLKPRFISKFDSINLIGTKFKSLRLLFWDKMSQKRIPEGPKWQKNIKVVLMVGGNFTLSPNPTIDWILIFTFSKMSDYLQLSRSSK